MAIEQIGVAGLTQENRIWYERGMLLRAVPYFAHYKPENARVATVPERGGNSINFRRLELIAATTTALTEGTPGAASQITVSAVNATIVQYGLKTLAVLKKLPKFTQLLLKPRVSQAWAFA